MDVLANSRIHHSYMMRQKYMSGYAHDSPSGWKDGHDRDGSLRCVCAYHHRARNRVYSRDRLSVHGCLDVRAYAHADVYVHVHAHDRVRGYDHGVRMQEDQKR